MTHFFDNSEILGGRTNIGIHLIFKEFGFHYPINRLRNVALDNVVTPYSFNLDVDFIPSKDIYNYLTKTIETMILENGISTMDRKALVVPAFENKEYKTYFPTFKHELLSRVERGLLSVFRQDMWPQGHGRTNYDKWKTSGVLYKVDWDYDYEPYLVTKTNVTRFDERFVGFGWNKVEWVMQLAAEGFEFLVLPEAFIVHNLHPPSYEIRQYREQEWYRNCLRYMKQAFSLEIQRKHSEFFKNSRAAV